MAKELKGNIKLQTPITVNGKKVKELTYDANEITPVMFAEAEARKMKASGSRGGNIAGAAEIDYGLHLYLGFAAIQAVNGNYDITDLERIKGQDVIRVMDVGRNFIMSSAIESQENDSDEQSETTQGSTTLQ